MDDGPSTNTTFALDGLKKYNAKGTFFVVGSRVLENPDILRRAYNEGHQIGKFLFKLEYNHKIKII
jgi:peptidoglycan/xylan/chitin deacetylase (PgdA/CDA1 family)